MNPQDNIRVDFENQKIHVGEGYQVGQIGIPEVFSMALTWFKSSFVWKQLEAAGLDSSINVHFERLSQGDPETIGLAAVSLFGGIAVAYYILSALAPDNEPTAAAKAKKDESEERDPPRDFTVEQLREFDGTKGKPIYVSLCREVFDVSAASDFYGEGSSYHCFAGRESTRAMAKLSFEEADLASLKNDDFGAFERSTLDDWYQKFKYYKCYPVVGKVSVPPKGKSFTKEMLLASKEALQAGTAVVEADRIDAPIYMAIKGNVLDVSYGGKEMYGPAGPYFKFAGIDASRPLGKMSFDPADLESSDLSDLTPEQLKVLDDWEKKFLQAKKYPIVGQLTN